MPSNRLLVTTNSVALSPSAEYFNNLLAHQTLFEAYDGPKGLLREVPDLAQPSPELERLMRCSERP